MTHEEPLGLVHGGGCGGPAMVTMCAACGSRRVHFDPADGWTCADCKRTDADE